MSVLFWQIQGTCTGQVAYEIDQQCFGLNHSTSFWWEVAFLCHHSNWNPA
jgi:hypothetical protein